MIQEFIRKSEERIRQRSIFPLSKPIRVALVILWVLCIIQVVNAVRQIVIHQPDAYHNEKWRLFSSSLAGLFVCTALLAQWLDRHTKLSVTGIALQMCAWMALLWSYVLSR